MPVQKFRSGEEMNRHRWREPGDPELYQAIRYVWELGQRTMRRQFPPGVYRHRTIDDAQAQRDAWDAANVRRHNHKDAWARVFQQVPA